MKKGCADLDQIEKWLEEFGFSVYSRSVPRHCGGAPSRFVEWSLEEVDEDWETDTDALSEDEREAAWESDRSDHQVVAIGPRDVDGFEPISLDNLADIVLLFSGYPEQAYLRTRDDVGQWTRWLEEQRQMYWASRAYLFVYLDESRLRKWPGMDLWYCPNCNFNLGIPRNHLAQKEARDVIRQHLCMSGPDPEEDPREELTIYLCEELVKRYRVFKSKNPTEHEESDFQDFLLEVCRVDPTDQVFQA